ncbi:hypothetical protein M3I53_36105 [Paraburkholderia sp. CNPSo 3272]|uniref:hypothetical protein n=1 Tax=Paraburkholderia sp. CNPSo 3272 TaxID=2940931 RepID=UPI0020B70D4B|nr:hypothetical protein [Paraburkholderia sp. CNPSo 3272]MCP3728471.1 hypothetical protein [Paraburkholderia sp. CNPSo 3272]
MKPLLRSTYPIDAFCIHFDEVRRLDLQTHAQMPIKKGWAGTETDFGGLASGTSCIDQPLKT